MAVAVQYSTVRGLGCKRVDLISFNFTQKRLIKRNGRFELELNLITVKQILSLVILFGYPKYFLKLPNYKLFILFQ